jgi:hypothetical protein
MNSFEAKFTALMEAVGDLICRAADWVADIFQRTKPSGSRADQRNSRTLGR